MCVSLTSTLKVCYKQAAGSSACNCVNMHKVCTVKYKQSVDSVFQAI